MSGQPHGESWWKNGTVPRLRVPEGREVQRIPYIVAEHPIAGERRLRVRSANTGHELVIEVDHPERFTPGERLDFRWTGMKRVGRNDHVHTGTLVGRYEKEIEHNRLVVEGDDTLTEEQRAHWGVEGEQPMPPNAQQDDHDKVVSDGDTNEERTHEGSVSAENQDTRMVGMVAEDEDGTRRLMLQDGRSFSEEEIPEIRGMFIASGAVLGFERSTDGGWDFIENFGQSGQSEMIEAVRSFLGEEPTTTPDTQPSVAQAQSENTSEEKEVPPSVAPRSRDRREHERFRDIFKKWSS